MTSVACFSKFCWFYKPHWIYRIHPCLCFSSDTPISSSFHGFSQLNAFSLRCCYYDWLILQLTFEQRMKALPTLLITINVCLSCDIQRHMFHHSKSYQQPDQKHCRNWTLQMESCHNGVKYKTTSHPNQLMNQQTSHSNQLKYYPF